jgi:methylated-DNA-[protein]-cysteine S-methyltransferase
MDTYSLSKLDSEIGTIFVIGTERGVSRVIFGRDEFEEYVSGLNGTTLVEDGRVEESVNEIKLYLEGKLKEFHTRLDLSYGTSFQISVWRELVNIPFGKVKTYSEIANKIGKPGAARAVGNAVGANPIPIIIPCHRVVATNGLGGYSGGIEIKKRLLRTEGVIR